MASTSPKSKVEQHNDPNNKKSLARDSNNRNENVLLKKKKNNNSINDAIQLNFFVSSTAISYGFAALLISIAIAVVMRR